VVRILEKTTGAVWWFLCHNIKVSIQPARYARLRDCMPALRVPELIMSTPLPTGTLTFLFTDIECSTQLSQKFPDRMKINMARHDQILRSAVAANRGYVFKTVGDEFCTAFAASGDALRAAIAAQSHLHAQAWGDAPIKVRMGIYTGNAQIQADGDYDGYASLSCVKRLTSAGHGGQTLLSQGTHDLVRDELPPGVSLRDLGEHCLKDLIHPEHIYQVDIPGLPAVFPALRTEE
jgi:class 3 adenylate cyclase